MKIYNLTEEIDLCNEIELKKLDCKSSLGENIRNIARYFEENSQKIEEYLSHNYYSVELGILFLAQKDPEITVKLKKRKL